MIDSPQILKNKHGLPIHKYANMQLLLASGSTHPPLLLSETSHSLVAIAINDTSVKHKQTDQI